MTREEFKEIRAYLGWSQDKLARKLRVFIRTVQRYESGDIMKIPEKIQNKMHGFVSK